MRVNGKGGRFALNASTSPSRPVKILRRARVEEAALRTRLRGPRDLGDVVANYDNIFSGCFYPLDSARDARRAHPYVTGDLRR